MPKRAKYTRKHKSRGGESQEELNKQRREDLKKKEEANEAAKIEWKQDIEKRCYEFYKPYLEKLSEWEKKPLINRMNIFDESVPTLSNHVASYNKEHHGDSNLPNMCKQHMTLEQAKEIYKKESSTPQPVVTQPASTGGKKSKKTKTSKNQKKRKGSRKSKT